MIPPRITRTGAIISDGRDVEVNGGGSLHLVLLATPDETEDARALAEVSRVRITIEPVSPEQIHPGLLANPAHGSALDYLSQINRLLTGLLDGPKPPTRLKSRRVARRCRALVNSASLSLLNAQRRTP